MRDMACQLSTVGGAVAECGVLRRNFAALINQLLPTKKLNLLDTFTGFDNRDTSKEDEQAGRWLYEKGGAEYYALGSEFLTLLRCPNYKMVSTYKGFVPDTFEEIEDMKYCFVNLDMDLYAPTLSAIRYFAPRIEAGGMLLLRDYFCDDLPGIKKAVDEAGDSLTDFIRFSVSDGYSLALMKKD